MTHSSGLAQCRSGSPVLVDRNPVRMRLPHVVADRVRIGARDDAHAERAAAGDERAERIRLTEPRAAMVQRHLGRVVGDDAAGAERGGVGVEAAEVVEPELRVEAAGVVLDERELHPAHRPIEPARQQLAGFGRRRDDLRRRRVVTRLGGAPRVANAPAPVACRKPRRESECGMRRIVYPGNGSRAQGSRLRAQARSSSCISKVLA